MDHSTSSPTNHVSGTPVTDETDLASVEARDTDPLESQTKPLVSHVSENPGENSGINESRETLVTGLRSPPWLTKFLISYRTREWSMYYCLVAGTVFAISHHAFYSSLHMKEALDQSLMLRYGTVLAFLAKASLGTAVITAFRQRAWLIVRHKMLRVGTVDSLFTATEDISALLDWKAIRHAKIAVLMAIYVWATPLIVILCSQSLSVGPWTKEDAALCPSARTLNFNNEGTNNWRESTRIENLISLSFSLWNATVSWDEFDPKDPNSFDYWASESAQGIYLVEGVFYLGQAAARGGAANDICTNGWNCSYVVDFLAPGYECKKLASGVGSKVKKLGDAKVPFRIDKILPTGDYKYIAITDEGEYAAQQSDCRPGGMPKEGPPYSKTLGVFKTEPIIWIGYASVDDLSTIQPSNRSDEGAFDVYTPNIIGCEHYITNYTVEFNYSNGVQSYHIKNRHFIEKVINTTYIPGELDDSNPNWDSITAVPKANYILPNDTDNYRRTAAYHAIGKIFRDYLNGTIDLANIAMTNAHLTNLMDPLNYLPVAKFPEMLQKLYDDIIISLLSAPQFTVVSWAKNGQSSGVGRGGSETNYPCIRQRRIGIFLYNSTQLCLVYTLAILLALACVLFALEAVREEGMTRDMKFSSIVEATRAPDLNEIRSCSTTGSSGPKIGLGWVTGYAGEGRRGFGLEGGVVQDNDQRPLDIRRRSVRRRLFKRK